MDAYAASTTIQEEVLAFLVSDGAIFRRYVAFVTPV